jgi:cyanate permease
VLDRIEADRADSRYDRFTAEKFWSYICDIHIWGFALLLGCASTAGYAFAYFLPIILVEGMGYSSRDAQLLAAPPAVFASIFAFALAIVIDRKRSFAPLIVFPACLTIVGLCMVCLLVHYLPPISSHSVRADGLPYEQLGSICRCLSR